MIDLILRLHYVPVTVNTCGTFFEVDSTRDLHEEAAGEIERLRKELAEAKQPIEVWYAERDSLRADLSELKERHRKSQWIGNGQLHNLREKLEDLADSAHAFVRLYHGGTPDDRERMAGAINRARDALNGNAEAVSAQQVKHE